MVRLERWGFQLFKDTIFVANEHEGSRFVTMFWFNISQGIRQEHEALHERLSTVAHGMTEIKFKAEKSDVVQLKDVVSEISGEIRKREGVLFGAKCLSCNRVFDDIGECYTNQIDLQGEKNKNAFLNQVSKPAGTEEFFFWTK